MSEYALIIAQHGAHLYQLVRGKPSLVATASEHQDIGAWLEQYFPMRAYCSLVNDIMDESYVQSNLPPIWLPSLRHELIERRLIQQLRDSPYRAAVCAPSGSWRPPTRVSLVGMGQNERVRAWIDALSFRHAKLKGLWPLSILVALALDKTSSPARVTGSGGPSSVAVRPTLALIATGVGLRQVLVRGRTPLFSRLALATTDEPMSATSALAEARRTVAYLIAHNWIDGSEVPLATQLWLPEADEQAFVEVSNDPMLRVTTMRAVGDSYLTLLPYLKQAAAQLQFLPESHRMSWRATLIARNVRWMGYAALLMAGAWSGAVVWESLEQRNAAARQMVRAAKIDQQSRQEVLQAKGDLSQAGLAVATVHAWQQNIDGQPDQAQAIQHLSIGLAAAPRVVVQSLRWEVAPVSSAGITLEPIACPKTYAAWGVTAEAPAPPDPATSAKPVVALLRFSVLLPADISQRSAIEMQDLLRSKLESATWAAYITQSSLTPDISVPLLGVAGESSVRKVDYCLQKTET